MARSALGGILVDGRGRTLYLFEKDREGQHLRQWLHDVLAAALEARQTRRRPWRERIPARVTHRGDGITQVTYAGHPLYRFVQDSRPGQTTGQDSQAFGAEIGK